jgi:Domain of unknown function (DUF222)
MTGADHQDDRELESGAGADLAGAGLAGAPVDGLSWSWEVDLEALVAAVADPAPWERDIDKSPSRPDAVPSPVDADAELAEYLEAVEAGRSREIPLAVVAGRMAESVPAGVGLAGWLAAGPVAGLEDGALAGMAASYRRLASWAQAGELSVVAELASRSAAANERIGVDDQGRPGRLPDEACAEVSLALTMSQGTASWWTDLGITLRWRLVATGAALRAGSIDLARARAIAEATALLDDETARAVEALLLAGAGAKTLAGLRAALRRAVIAADPQGAERRREEAERRAKVVLYPDVEGTASLAGYNLPGVPAAAAMARISALARALKASGAGGGIDLLRAHVLLGLLLGTLPHIPPPADGPPDTEPPDDSLPDEEPLDDGSPSDGGLPEDGLPGDDQSPDDRQRDDDPPSGGVTGGRTRAGRLGRDDDHTDRAGRRDDRGGQRNDQSDQHDDWDDQGARPPPAWPDVPPLLQPGPSAMGNLAPAGGGLLDLRVPWATLTGQTPEPGYLGRLGPITPTQASYLADRAARDPTARWRVIVTDSVGRAVAVTHVTGLTRRAGKTQAGLVGQVTVIISQQCLTEPQETVGLPPILARVLAAAQAAAAQAARDGRAAGGCAHAGATPAYRPTRTLWEYVTARDLTCRFGPCRQPATRCDLDHTIPFDQGGLTCSCNLGGLCRFHHQIKGRPRWHLTQVTPGTFTWTTPTGRTYTVQPDSYAA